MSDKSAISVVFDLGNEIKVFPSLFLDNNLEVDPADLSKFAPQGISLYGHKESNIKNPFHVAPIYEPSWGLVYFGCNVAKQNFEAFLNMMNINTKEKDYVVFAQSAENPCADGYTVQIRIISKFALKCMYHLINDKEYEAFDGQKLTIAETLWKFIETEKNRWGTSIWVDKGLEGMFGGDGDCEREELSFGFMLENEYYGIYRIWSRAWLVTK